MNTLQSRNRKCIPYTFADKISYCHLCGNLCRAGAEHRNGDRHHKGNCVDEFQDTSPIQSFIISEIRKEESIVGVIGDSAQAIYGFQGADIQLFKKYKVKTENEYSINENHRSDGEIVKFLNILRGNFTQIACETYAGALICLYTGNRNDAFQKAKEICVEEKLVSLSRDNITSNAMKIYPNIEENEEHRVYYVALSRAKKRLKINMESRLKKLLEIVKIFIF